MVAGLPNSPAPDSVAALVAPENFSSRHLGLTEDDRRRMLEVLGFESLEDLLASTVPSAIRLVDDLALGEPVPEHEVHHRLRALFADDVRRVSMIGQGYHGTITPPVIRRNVLENPAWYTAYTPYQPEISQGRLEALLNFQTMVAELTALPLANASLLDEATAAAEAMTMALRTHHGDSMRFMVDADTHPQTIAVLRTRAEPLGIDVAVRDLAALDPADSFGVLVSWPSSTGRIDRLSEVRRVVAAAGSAGVLSVACTDLLACTILASPGEIGFDVAVGSAQRFGVPMGHGGPHAAFISVRDSLSRALPGRLVGVSTDADGRPALRLALQTREQHIRREKATSNICTAQVLLANIAGLYGAWHGPDGLVRIARRVNSLASASARILVSAGFDVATDEMFDTVLIRSLDAALWMASAREAGINIRLVDSGSVSFSVDETTTPEIVVRLLRSFGCEIDVESLLEAPWRPPSDAVRRQTRFMEQSVFNRLHSEHEMLRYLRRLADRDLALDRTMIPLGSCTMKLNATTEMEPISWPEIADLHPFVPDDECIGYRRLVHDLEAMLCAVTGYDAVSLQPNAGSQGEFAGLLAIRAYHRSRGESERTLCLIPQSAHGTNAASAVMAGMEVVVVGCDGDGNVDVSDLRAKASAAGSRLAALMVTYPSTHGVFEESITEICALIHDLGGQVYVDGANLNALVGLAQPGRFGADVSHLNLHKTFCIPHGGGGPGVGPVAVRSHLADFLPGHPLRDDAPVGPVSAAPYGSAGILAIPWTYISMMGGDGLRSATADAILSANYVARRLAGHFPTLYTGDSGTVAHECILDLREVTRRTGVTVDDVAKRLMDHMFHAPTMSFPVAGTLMVEPTESESLAELDRFIASMISIAGEIEDVAAGRSDVDQSPLRHAPHPVEDLVAGWTRPYRPEQAAFPLVHLRNKAYFPPVSRIDAAYGDRNLVCTCAPIEAYSSELALGAGPAAGTAQAVSNRQ